MLMTLDFLLSFSAASFSLLNLATASFNFSLSNFDTSQRLAAAQIFMFFPDAKAHNCQSTFTIDLTYLLPPHMPTLEAQYQVLWSNLARFWIQECWISNFKNLFIILGASFFHIFNNEKTHKFDP